MSKGFFIYAIIASIVIYYLSLGFKVISFEFWIFSFGCMLFTFIFFPGILIYKENEGLKSNNNNIKALNKQTELKKDNTIQDTKKKNIVTIVLYIIGFIAIVYVIYYVIRFSNSYNRKDNNLETYLNNNYNFSTYSPNYNSNNKSNDRTKGYSSKDWSRYSEYHKYIGCTKEEVISALGNNYYTSTNKLVYTGGHITEGLTASISITFEFKNDRVFRIKYYDQSVDNGMPTYIE